MSAEDTNTHHCGCPTCRMARGEITPSEYAWYLKGKIEAFDGIIRSKKANNYGKEDYQYENLDQELRYKLMDEEDDLSMLIREKLKGQNIDPAWKTPRDFICKECVKHG